MGEAKEGEKLEPLIKYVNLRNYDLVPVFSVLASHPTPLYSTPEQLLSVD